LWKYLTKIHGRIIFYLVEVFAQDFYYKSSCSPCHNKQYSISDRSQYFFRVEHQFQISVCSSIILQFPKRNNMVDKETAPSPDLFLPIYLQKCKHNCSKWSSNKYVQLCQKSSEPKCVKFSKPWWFMSNSPQIYHNLNYEECW
jgi:hypothetical protein